MTQVFGIVISFTCLSISCCKLYYSQRVGRLQAVDASIKMISYIFPAIVLQLLFPLFSLIIMTTYLKGFVLIVVAVAIVANALVLKPPCLDKQIVSLPFLYRQKPVKGIKDNNTIFLTALLTSWIAPFTVWMNGWIQTRFLLASFITTFIVHAFGLGVTCLYAFHSNTFKHDFVVVITLAVTFLLISSVSSIWLYWNGSYLFLFHMTKIFCCASPIIHPMFLQERSPDSEVVQTALKSKWKLFFNPQRNVFARIKSIEATSGGA